MGEDRQAADGRTNAPSAVWQPADVAAHAAELANYLEQAAATPAMRKIADRTPRALALAPGRRVLEVGCGSGVFLPLLANAVGEGGAVVGIDHAPDFVARACERVTELGLVGVVTVEVADANRLPFADASFDAAHCERVLMHVEDPTAAVREMGRVVKPGGRVVAVEPDWRGARVDHPDRAVFDLLMDRWISSTRNPGMGWELRRRFADAGLVDRAAEAVIWGVADFAELATYGLDLTEPAAELIAEGRLDRTRARAAIGYLTAASRDGAFFSYGGLAIAVGRVPSSRANGPPNPRQGAALGAAPYPSRACMAGGGR